MARTTKQLKDRTFNYADGSNTTKRHAVIEDGKRIGTVYETCHDCGTVNFTPLRGVNRGKTGDGSIIVVDFTLQVRRSLVEAVALI